MLLIPAGSLLQQLCNIYGWEYLVDRIFPDAIDRDFVVIVHPYEVVTHLHYACSCCVTWGGYCFPEEYVSIPIQLGVLIHSFLNVKHEWPLCADIVQNILLNLGLPFIRNLSSVDAFQSNSSSRTNIIRITPDFCCRGICVLQICRPLLHNHGHLALTEASIVPAVVDLQASIARHLQVLRGFDARREQGLVGSQLCALS